MPVLTRWYLKSSFLCLLLAVAFGIILAARAPLNLPGSISAFRPIYFHLLMVGWVTQLIFGVVYWMFPKYSRENPRGSQVLGWSTFWLLNIGLGIRLIAEPALSLNPVPVWGWLLAASAVLQWMAGMLFVLNTWRRVKVR